MTNQHTLELSMKRYRDQRNRFLEKLGEDAAIIFSAPEHHRNGDAEYPYRQSSDLIYLTGWIQPQAVVLLRPKAKEPFVMFVQPKEPSREIWTGIRPGPEGAVNTYGADAAYPISELSKRLPAMLQGYSGLHFDFGENEKNDALIRKSIASARKLGKNNGMAFPNRICSLSHTLHELRLIKSKEEIEVLKKAASITKDAHCAAMKATKPGVYEYELEAELLYHFRKNGGSGPGYTPIVGGGSNAVILHYIENDSQLQDGDLVCIDAGCEFEWYTADVTRTWPVNGTFTDAQKDLYTAVLIAQEKSIQASVVGKSFMDVHFATVKSLVESMIELGFLEGDVEELIEEKAYAEWYMHGTSHWLGMDVHDVGTYASEGNSMPLAEGMVLTIEPGLYIAADDERVPEKYRGIGIRIEDDILITKDGPRVLTEEIPKTIDEIESFMKAKA